MQMKPAQYSLVQPRYTQNVLARCRCMPSAAAWQQEDMGMLQQLAPLDAVLKLQGYAEAFAGSQTGRQSDLSSCKDLLNPRP